MSRLCLFFFPPSCVYGCMENTRYGIISWHQHTREKCLQSPTTLQLPSITIMSVTRSRILKNDSNMNAISTKERGLTDLLGKLRASKEVTEIGCLLMLVGLAEVIQPTTWISGLVNGSPTEAGTTDTKGLPFSTLMGYVFCVTIGVVTVLIGYAAAFPQQSPQHQFPSSKGAKLITTLSSIFVQTAYVLTVSTCMTVARIAIEGKSFLRSSSTGPPPALEDQPNNGLLAAMGVLLILSYWFGMLGSISVLLGSLGKFQSGQGHERDGRYYGSRLFFYSFILWLGGAAQTVIGVHLEMTHHTKGGPITDDGSAFYKVAMLVVSYPSMSIAVGALQVRDIVVVGLLSSLSKAITNISSSTS